MPESAYSINERASTTLGLTLSHPVKALIGHRGNHIVTHTSPVYTTAKANRRQLIADKGSFDGGDTVPVVANIGTLWNVTVEAHDLPLQSSVGRQDNGSLGMPSNESPATTFRAALTERCFRYLDCFNGDKPGYWLGHACDASVKPIGCPVWRSGVWSKGSTPSSFLVTFKAVYLSIQLDRITQTKQGGCLYEQPVVKSLALNKAIVAVMRSPRAFAESLLLNILQRHFWQKPGIGMAAVSPVPNRDFRKGEGTDYPYP